MASPHSLPALLKMLGLTATQLFNLQALSTSILHINVKDPAYGAVGDGVTDDTGPINAALQAAKSQGGGVLYFPLGNYLVSSTININASGIRLLGEAKETTRIFTNDTSVTPLSIGAGVDNKTNSNGIENITISAASNADSGVYGVSCVGCTFLNFDKCQVLRGTSGLYMRNVDRFLIEDTEVEVYDDGANAVHLVQGEEDDVTIGTFVGLYATYREANSTGMLFDDGVGSSLANEFNRIAVIGARIGGNNNAGTRCLNFNAGARNLVFMSTQLRQGRVASADFTSLDSTYKIRVDFKACAFFGNGDNNTVDHIKVDQTQHDVIVENCEFTKCTNGITASGNNPRIALRNIEASVVTGNLLNQTSGNPKVSISGYGDFTASVIGKIDTGWEVRWSGDVIGDWISRAEGSGEVVDTATTDVITFDDELDWTPSTRDVHIVWNNSPTNPIGNWKITGVSSTGFTVTVDNTQGATGATFQYRVGL